MNNLFEEMINDAGNVEVSDDGVKSLTELCESLQSLERKQEEVEAYLKDLKATIDDLSTNKIPDKLLELGVTELKLANGAKVYTSKKYIASIAKDPEKSKEAFNWLIKNGHGAIIKKQIVIPYTFEDSNGTVPENIKVAIDALKALELSFIDDGTIAWQTLRAFVKEQLESGEDVENFPKDLFNVYIQNVTKIK